MNGPLWCSGLQSLPQPLLQGGETDEHAIGGEQQMLTPAIPGALPGELQRLDEDQARRRAPPWSVDDDGIGREARDVRE